MRIGVFEVDFAVHPVLSIAEVLSGEAHLLRSLSVRNVRGCERDWINISADINGIKVKNSIVIRDVHVNDYYNNTHKGKTQSGLLIPTTLLPGKYDGELRISYSASKSIYGGTGEVTIPFALNIMSSSWVPTDFAHATYLASWVKMNDEELRRFASKACEKLNNDSPELCTQAIYEGLLRRNLMYQPVPSTPHPDFQLISGYHYILQNGGSCMELSLMMASLLMIRGLSPVLLLYGNHATAGCFSSNLLPVFETMENPEQIRDMILQHQLILPEMTDVCSLQQLSFSDSLKHAFEWLKENKKAGCCLVNLKTVLRKGTIRVLSDSFQDMPVKCPHCGYDHILPQETDSEITCPACGQIIQSTPKTAVAPVTVPDTVYDPSQIRYECRGQIAGVARYISNTIGTVHILPRWKNKPVTYIADHAFENSELNSIILPDTISDILDRAFRGCEKMTSIQLPPNLSRLGTGAFSSSGLKSIRIPGNVDKIPVLCFSGCEHLETVTLEDGIREIDSQAFVHCPQLKCIYLPTSVKRVSETAFDPSCRLIYTSSQTILK